MPTFNSGVDWTSALAPLLAGEQMLFQNQQQKYDRKRQQDLDPLTMALTQSQIDAQKAGTVETRARTESLGYNPDTGAPNTPSVQYEQIPAGASPDKIFQIATRNLAKAAQSRDQQGVKDWGGLAQTSALGYERVTQGAFTQGARTDLTRATTSEVKAKTKNISGQFEHDIEMLKARGANAQSVARIHAAYRRAGGGAAATSAAEQRAMLAAMNTAEREQVDVKNSEMMREYYRQQGLHDANPDDNPAPSQPQLQTPPIVIMGPGGQPITVNVPSAPAAPHSAAAPHAAPAAPQPQGGGNPLGGIMHAIQAGVQHLFGGGQQQDRFVKGQVYTDAKGRHAKYLGNGQWQPVP